MSPFREKALDIIERQTCHNQKNTRPSDVLTPKNYFSQTVFSKASGKIVLENFK